MIEITRNTEISKELIKELKTEHKKLFKTVLDDEIFLWHKLNRKDYKAIMKKFENIEDRDERLWAREEEACRLAVLYPCAEVLNEILEESAGMATMLSDEIYEKSGFKTAEKTEEV